MSGCLVHSERLEPPGTWIVAGWVFRNALESIADQIAGESPTLAQRLRDATEGFEYLDLRGLAAEEFRSFHRGAVAARDKWLRAGPTSFHDPSFFAGFIDRFADLIELAAADDRVRGGAS
jgi:hypothetical protein